jgi:hypothetical protein
MPSVVITNNPKSGGDINVIRSFFNETCSLLFRHSPKHPCAESEIRVIFGADGPEVKFGGNPDVGYDVHLNSDGNYWDNHVYQFAHETCHILAQFLQTQHCNQWFEESLCEAASLFTLKTLSRMGAMGKGPSVGLESGSIPYHECLSRYADQYLNSLDRAIPDVSIQQWFKTNEITMRHSPYCRSLNGVVANKMFGRFLSEPSNWNAAEFLNTEPCGPSKDSFSEYLGNWKSAAPGICHSFIDDIRSMLLPGDPNT